MIDLSPHISPPRSNRLGCCCAFFLAGILLVCVIPVLVLSPGRTTILILGIDTRELGSNLGRSDTMILITFVPFEPYVGMLSIPRDLQVTIPDVGENRINTAHFYAEAEKPGSGPKAAIQTVEKNFGVNVDYYIRIRFDGVRTLVEAVSGVDVELPNAMSGYSAGTHHLDGQQALAFIRDRTGSDDLYRTERGQIFIRALLKRLLGPGNWEHWPGFFKELAKMVDTNIPFWQTPRLGVTLLRVGAEGIDGRVFTHEMVTPTTTLEGAEVLNPNWELINPLVKEMFE